MTKEQQKELEELAELLMQSENLAASIEMLKQFQSGTIKASRDIVEG